MASINIFRLGKEQVSRNGEFKVRERVSLLARK